MLEILERLDRQTQDVVAGLVAEARHDRHAAGVVLVAGVVQAIGLLWLARPGHLQVPTSAAPAGANGHLEAGANPTI